jgi:hypothetical protein
MSRGCVHTVPDGNGSKNEVEDGDDPVKTR